MGTLAGAGDGGFRGAATRLGAILAIALALVGGPGAAPPATASAAPTLAEETRGDGRLRELLAPIVPEGLAPLIGGNALAIPADVATLAPAPSSAAAIDTVRLVARRTATLRGSGSWDDGFAALQEAFGLLARRTAEAGIAPAGRPFVVFTETDDRGFRFSAMLPVASDAPELATIGLEEGESPAGHALRFVHAGPFADIDATYDLITSHLDAEGFEAQESFVEEYVTDAVDDGDPSLVVFIYVFLR